MAEARVCPETGLPMVRGSRPTTITFKGYSRTIDMPGWYREGSDEGIHSREDMKVSDRVLVTLKALSGNLITPDEISHLRTSLGLSQVEASRIIGGGPRAFQKYESGEVLTSRAMSNLLRALERHPEDVEYLRKAAAAAQVEDEREFA